MPSLPTLSIDDLLLAWAAQDPPRQPFRVSHVLGSLELPPAVRPEVLQYLVAQCPWKLTVVLVPLCANGHRGSPVPATYVTRDNGTTWAPTALMDPPSDACPSCSTAYQPEEEWLVEFLFALPFQHQANDVRRRGRVGSR